MGVIDFRLEKNPWAMCQGFYWSPKIPIKFCQICGVSPYPEGKDQQGNRSVAVNIRCIENIDLEKIPVTHFNGRDF